MPKEQYSPLDDTLAGFSNPGVSFFDWNFPASVHEFRHDQHHAVQQQHMCQYYDDGDTQQLPDMWENWLNLTSEPQTLDTVFDGSSSCTSTSPNFSSQTWANSLPNGSTSSTLAAMDTSFIQPLSLSSTALSNIANEHNLHASYENNHVNESLMKPYPLPPETDLMAPLSPPTLDIKATARQPMSYMKPKASFHKIKTEGSTRTLRNNGARKNEEAQTYLVESTDDGYAWHKYGQKSIKNRMHPRGYFRCAHPNCPVKKQTELSSDMHGLLSITYIGKHSHSCSSNLKHKGVACKLKSRQCD